MTKRHFVRWIGRNNHSITHHPYIFRRDEWIMVSEDRGAWYKKKAHKNPNSWEHKEEELAEKDTIYMARFLGIPGKTEVLFAVRPKDEFGEPDPKKEYDYLFKKGIWVQIKYVDVVTFKNKGEGNHFWEYKKVIVEKGTLPSELTPKEPPKEDPKKKKKGKKKTEEPVVEPEAPEPEVEEVD